MATRSRGQHADRRLRRERRLSSLFGLRPDETLYALLAVLFALLPVTIWILARRSAQAPPQPPRGCSASRPPCPRSSPTPRWRTCALVLAPAALVFAVLGLEDLTSGSCSSQRFCSAADFGLPRVRRARRDRRARRRVGEHGSCAVMGGDPECALGRVNRARDDRCDCPLSACRALSCPSRIEGDIPSWPAPAFHDVREQWRLGLRPSPPSTSCSVGICCRRLRAGWPSHSRLLWRGSVAVGAFRSVRLACLVAVPILVSIASDCSRTAISRRALRVLPLDVADVHAPVSRRGARARPRRGLAVAAVKAARAAVALSQSSRWRSSRVLTGNLWSAREPPGRRGMSPRDLDDVHVPLPQGAHVLVEGADAG